MLKEFLFLVATAGNAETYNQETYSDAPTEADYDAAADFNVSRGTFFKMNRERSANLDVEAIQDNVARDLKNITGLPTAVRLDRTLEVAIERGNATLRHFGHADDADKIEVEFNLAYKGYFVRQHANGGVPVEIGEHPPLNVWLELVHAAFHIKLGDKWCQYFHVHDIFILNFSIPVVFKPSAFEQLDYLDHFAGHPIDRWTWDHHGFAGVVTYWAVNISCGAATAGMGVATFACGPISTMAENFMDRRIAPPLGTKIWTKAQNNGR